MGQTVPIAGNASIPHLAEARIYFSPIILGLFLVIVIVGVIELIKIRRWR